MINTKPFIRSPYCFWGIFGYAALSLILASVSIRSASKRPVAMAVSVESRLRGALWGFFSGDALASPTHWYYGGPPQVRADYGNSGIVGYTKPSLNLPGSILNKSNTNGGGRGSFKKKDGISIIGDIINHGKREYWDPHKSIHYHATLQAGENTLEAQLARVLMKSIVASGGRFDPGHFRKAYVEFMTTPNSHNDTYASTCHRMFFANLIFQKLPPEKCPDNDHHNVDTIDGIVLPTITALAISARGGGDSASVKEEARSAAASTAAVTRESAVLERTSRIWSDLVHDTLFLSGDLTESLNTAARNLGIQRLPNPHGRDEMSSCYLDGSLPTTLDMIAKYMRQNDAWTGLLANANIGGENVHRGAILGAVLGARAGHERLPRKMLDGLHNRDELAKEIDEFVNAVMNIIEKEL